MRSAERRKVNVLEMKCLRSLVGVYATSSGDIQLPGSGGSYEKFGWSVANG